MSFSRHRKTRHTNGELVKLLLVFLVLWLATQSRAEFSSAKVGDCGLSYVEVRYRNPIDLKIACEGIARAQRFFSHFDFEPAGQKIKVEFKEEVLTPLTSPDGKITEYMRVYGQYNRSTELIEMSEWGTDYLMERKVFDYLNNNIEYHSSVVAHEVSHRYHHILSVQRKFHMAHATSEFIAYNVQIETMAEREKGEVLSLWPGEALDFEMSINGMIWASAPHKFGVLSYRFWKKAAPDIIQRMLFGKFEDPDRVLDMMFPPAYQCLHQ
ncbi:MAG: hypothetical protein IT288_02650 [Bdellovibrionales bacterium]|nr:hypothetical protein [Bdellovibrionales bacterium]